MEILNRALDLIRVRSAQGPMEVRPNYRLLMEAALHRVRVAELQIKEATTIEDLDIGRSSLLAGWAEVQQLVRTAKREQGIALRPISETEDLHRRLKDYMNQGRDTGRPASRRRQASTQ